MNSYRYAIKAKWSFEPLSPTEVGDRFLQTLALIVQQAPQTAGWSISSQPYAESYMTIDGARENIPQWVEDNIAVIDGEPDADYGYRLYAGNKPELTAQSLGFSTAVGGKYVDRINFEVGSIMIPSDPDVVTYPLFRAVMSSILAVWPCDSAYAYAFNNEPHGFPVIPGISPHPSSRFHRRWMGYLSASRADGLTPPADLPTERTPDGGLLMIAATGRLDPANSEEMRRSMAIDEIMRSRLGEI
jgi:hypothetical protein